MGFNSLPALKLGKKPFDDFKESFPGMNLTHILLFVKCLLIKPRCSICSVFNKVIPPPSNVDSVVRFPKISLSLLYCQYVKRYCNFIPPPFFYLEMIQWSIVVRLAIVISPRI